MVTRSYVIGLPVIVTVEDGPPWETGARVRWEIDTSEAAREVERSDDSGYTEEEERADAAAIREWIERHPTVASVVEAIGGNPWTTKLQGECVCGGEIELVDGKWFHSRIDDGSHEAEPV